MAWASGALLLLVAVAANVEGLAFASAARRGDLARARAAAERLRWLGRESPEHHIELARLFNLERDVAQVRVELERSIAVYPTPQGWRLIGAYHAAQHDWPGALAAYQRSLDLASDYLPSLVGSARSLASVARRDEALAMLARAAEIAPTTPPSPSCARSWFPRGSAAAEHGEAQEGGKPHQW